MIKTPAAFFLCLFSSLYLPAAPGGITIQALAAASDLIVVAKVDLVRTGGLLDKKRIASATVLEVWKGKKTGVLEFRAYPLRSNDFSDALAGETAILFLKKAGKKDPYQIAGSGRGRMPVRTVYKGAYASLWIYDILLPKGTHTIDGPDQAMRDALRSVKLNDLKKILKPVLIKLSF
jgi:hypothetical protein